MPDDRPADDVVGALAALQKKFDDMASTLAYRASRGNTGTIEPTFRSTPPADALFLQGQTVSRATYPVLWQWIVDNGMGSTGFTTGDGSTTFGLPNFQGRVLVGVGTLGSDVYTLASLRGVANYTQSVPITTSNMPSHNHNVSIDDHGAHSHGISGDGSHSGHQPSGFGGAGGGAALIQQNDQTEGFHNHGGAVGNTNISGHNLSQSGAGGGVALPVPINTQQPSISVNFMIWT